MTTLLAHGGTVSLSDLSGAWSAPPLVIVPAAVVLALFVQGFVRLRRRGRADRATFWSLALFASGLAVGVLALVSPLDEAGEEYLLSAHMAQHLLIGDVAPVLVVLALRGPLTFFLLPGRALRLVASLTPLRRLVSALLRPGVSFSLWALAMLAWHVPRFYDYVLTRPVVHDLEHASFVLVGTLVWIQLVDPARHERLTRGGRIAFALGLLLIGHPIIDGLLFSGPAFDAYVRQDERLFGLAAATDQHLAGAVMLVEQTLTLGICVGVLLAPYLRERRARRAALAVSEGQ